MLVVTSASDVSPVLRGTFASSTKYLMQSSWPYVAADMHTVDFTSSDIFLSSTRYFKMSK